MPQEGLPYKSDRGSSLYLLGIENAVLRPLREFIFKKSTVVAYAVPFRV